MGDADNTRVGVCNVSFNSVDLGYTKGNVSVTYGVDSTEIEVDQADAPIDEVITKQNFEVTVPMAEYDLTKLVTLLPGATLVTDGTTPTKKKIVLSGLAGGSLLDHAAVLILTPVDGDANDKVTLFYAVPIPNISHSYEKNGVRVYEIKFKALVGDNGWVLLGDATATAA